MTQPVYCIKELRTTLFYYQVLLYYYTFFTQLLPKNNGDNCPSTWCFFLLASARGQKRTMVHTVFHYNFGYKASGRGLHLGGGGRLCRNPLPWIPPCQKLMPAKKTFLTLFKSVFDDRKNSSPLWETRPLCGGPNQPSKGGN